MLGPSTLEQGFLSEASFQALRDYVLFLELKLGEREGFIDPKRIEVFQRFLRQSFDSDLGVELYEV